MKANPNNHYATCTTHLLLLSIFLSFSLLPSAFSQIPQGFNYQAIARDGSGNPIGGQTIPVRISIQSDSLGGTVFWVELHDYVTTNSQGLFTLVVGKGVKQSGTAATFSAIDWSVTPKYIMTEVDYGGWKTLGSSKMWSVPYAMVSTTSDTWTTSGTDIYRANGNVGIGTTNPTFKFQVQGGESLFGYNSGNGSLRFTTGFGNSFMFKPLDHALQLQTDHIGFPTILYMDKSGPVGIGTDTPQGRLHVAGNTLVEGSLHAQAYTGFGDVLIVGNDSKIADINIANTLGIIGLMDANQGHIKLGANGPVISGYNGNVGIGTTIPNEKLDVEGSIKSNYLYIDPQDGLNEGGEMLLIGAGSNPSIAIDNWGGHVRMHTFSTGKYLHLVNGSIRADGTSVSNYFAGNVGIGNPSPASKLSVQVPTDAWADEVPLFEVKNKKGVPVLAVYNYGVRILVDQSDSKAVKGGFAVSGYDYTKAGGTIPLMIVNPDSIRFNINNKTTTKGHKGGFAVGSFADTKGPIDEDFMHIMPQNPSNSYNTFLGYQAGKQSSTGNYNVYIGHQSGQSNASGSSNVMIGNNTGNTATDADFSTFIGNSAGFNATGDENTFIGDRSGAQTTSGIRNTFVGTFSGWTNNTGSYNTHIGYYAGGASLGSGNVFLGNQAGQGLTGDNQLFINNGPAVRPLIWGNFSSTSRTVIIDGNASDNPLAFKFYVRGTAGGTSGWNISSDSRFKKDIITIDNPISKILNLRGVYFNWNDPDQNDTKQMGFIAQEAIATIPEVVNTSNGYHSMDYAPITALLVEGMKEQQGIIQNQQQQINAQNDKIEKLEKMMVEMQRTIASASRVPKP